MIIFSLFSNTIFGSIIVFAIIVLLLVTMLILAKNKLVPKGKVKISINEDKELEVNPGNNLLSTLSDNKIYLPSACGGGGTCAMCKCQILEGAGEILSTEKPHFTRKEQLSNWRLSCQVKVRNDLRIVIPDEIFGIKKWECEVVSNNNVATYIKEFVVRLPAGETLGFDPGGYIQIDVPKITVLYKDMDIEEEYREEWTQNKMWDLKMKNPEPIFRAYSMANHPAEGDIIKLNIRVATPPWNRKKNAFSKMNPGICSSYIFSLKPGDKVMISGPYGEFRIKETESEMVYIGGGAGMAPLRSQIMHLLETENSNRKISFWYGARSLREMFYVEDFKRLEKEHPNFKFYVALSDAKEEDNWDGLTGYIHNVVYDEYLSKHKEPEEIEYYLCGPQIMTDSVINMLDNLGVPGENIAFDDFGS